MSASRGFSLIELLTAIAILGLVAAIGVPAMSTITDRNGVRAAAGEIRSIFHFARSRAITRNRHVAVRFERRAGEWHYAIYEDGNGNGIRNREIERGIDPRIRDARPVLPSSPRIRIGLPPIPLRDPTSGSPLPPGASPVRFNQSTLCSFSPNGTATPGSIYLTDGIDYVAAVRVYGTTAKIRTLVWNGGSRQWSR